jgi:thiol-disulfide isomerase/thioredoxin
MKRFATLAVVAVAALAALAAGIHFYQRGSEPQADSSALYALSLPDVDGNTQSLGQWRGKVMVVNFWATWCAPCREEMPEFVRLQKEYGAKGLQFVGIAVDDVDKVRQFAKEIGLNYPSLIGGYGALELSRTLGNGVMALPFTVVVGRAGGVELTQLGPLKPAQLRQVIDSVR